MVDLTSEMASLWSALGRPPANRGRVVQFVSATTGEGTSTVAREFARLAAVRARKPVWLVDADVSQQEQLEIISQQTERFGKLGGPTAASPDGSSFYAITPSLSGKDGMPIAASRLLTARSCLGGRLWVTRFRGEGLRSGQRVEVVADPRYWDGMRSHAETIIVDAPAADRSDTAIVLAPYVDTTVLIVAAETTEANAPIFLRDEIDAVGGRIAGVVVNRSTYRTGGLMQRLAG